MIDLDELILRVQRTSNGFLDIQNATDEVFHEYPADTCLKIAKQFFASNIYQVRSLAVFLFGNLASGSSESVAILKQKVSFDSDWRVQEILAKAFDTFCSDMGYEQSLPTIREWLEDPNPNVRRAVSEGLRIWTSRPYFKDHPDIAIHLLSPLREDESEYVRKSAGNALRDISKKHPNLVREALQGWNLENKKVAQTYRLAARFLKDKTNFPGSLP